MLIVISFARCNFHQQMLRGKFIVVEGLDRTGKSSVTHFLAHSIINNCQNTVKMAFPDRSTSIGMMINNFLLNKVEMPHEAIHLLFSANRWESIRSIEEALESGKNVVCDRYWYSGVAYSYAKGLDMEWCIASDKGLRQPDLILYLHGTPGLLAQRSEYGKQRFETVEFQEQVSKGFCKVLTTVNQDILETIQIDGKDLPAILKEALERVTQRFGLSPQ